MEKSHRNNPMKLLIPEQSIPVDSTVPSQPRKLKKLLARLPNANMGELTRQVYQILRDINRQTIPVKARLENMEMLREPTREIFNHLKKYFVNRTLPLPEKSKKIINLNQSLLQEMAYGYKIILSDTANHTSIKITARTRAKIQATACCRSIHYLAELVLRSSEIYTPPPVGLWRDLHQIYLFAETRELLNIAINDNEMEKKTVTIESCYKQILLFSLARPVALSQSDCERVFHKLAQWAEYGVIEPEPDKNDVNTAQIDKIFCIHSEKDTPPDYLNKDDLQKEDIKRYLNTTQLVTHTQKLIDLSTSKQEKLAIGNEISIASLQVLLTNWGTNPKRRFTRSKSEGKIDLAIGLITIVKTLNALNKKAKGVDTRSGIIRTEQTVKNDPGFTLETIHDDSTASTLSGYVTRTEKESTVNNSWDMVARGTVLTDVYDQEQKKNNQKPLDKYKKNTESHWEIVNISAGGYCLRWNSDDTSRAQIGEVIALHEYISDNKYEWRTGVIRWIQFTHENGLEIGIQVISTRLITASVQRANRPGENPFDCLILPGIKALKQQATIILPAHAFKTNDKLTVAVVDKKLPVTLGKPKENTGSFTQFYYTNTDEVTRIKKQAKKQQASQTKDDFDEIWSSL